MLWTVHLKIAPVNPELLLNSMVKHVYKFKAFTLPTVHSTTCEQEWICTVCVGRGKHVIFNSKTEKFWERRVVEIANDYHLSLLTNFFKLEGLA